MRRYSLCLCFATLLAANAAMAATSDPMSPVGAWTTIDDETKKPESVVRIAEKDGVISGAIEKILDPAKQDAKCEECANDDPRKGKPVVGMTILTGLKKEGVDVYGGGRVLDPNNGKTYNARVTVIEGGKKLEMRGSILFIGRTQTWIRTE
jgi:uncharacterized protein (DUF2147 family)